MDSHIEVESHTLGLCRELLTVKDALMIDNVQASNGDCPPAVEYPVLECGSRSNNGRSIIKLGRNHDVERKGDNTAIIKYSVKKHDNVVVSKNSFSEILNRVKSLKLFWKVLMKKE